MDDILIGRDGRLIAFGLGTDAMLDAYVQKALASK
jgi:hypothetical protein